MFSILVIFDIFNLKFIFYRCCVMFFSLVVFGLILWGRWVCFFMVVCIVVEKNKYYRKSFLCSSIGRSIGSYFFLD